MVWKKNFFSCIFLRRLSCISFQFPRGTPKKHSPASFFVFLLFVVFTFFGLKNARVFSKCFLCNISFWILKLFVFPAVAHFLGKELVGERSLDGLYPRLRFVSLKDCGLTSVTLAKSSNQQRFLTAAAALEITGIRCPSTAVLVVS